MSLLNFNSKFQNLQPNELILAHNNGKKYNYYKNNNKTLGGFMSLFSDATFLKGHIEGAVYRGHEQFYFVLFRVPMYQKSEHRHN